MSQISKHGSVYWVLPFKLPWDDNFSKIVINEGVNVFETYLHDIEMARDKIHATPKGYKALTELIWNDITK